MDIGLLQRCNSKLDSNIACSYGTVTWKKKIEHWSWANVNKARGQKDFVYETHHIDGKGISLISSLLANAFTVSHFLCLIIQDKWKYSEVPRHEHKSQRSGAPSSFGPSSWQIQQWTVDSIGRLEYGYRIFWGLMQVADEDNGWWHGERRMILTVE